MTIIPLHDRVVIEPIAVEEKTATGIYMPESANEKNVLGAIGKGFEGYVKATGPDVKSDLRVGDKVLYKQSGGTALKSDTGTKLLTLAERDVLAVTERAEYVYDPMGFVRQRVTDARKWALAYSERFGGDVDTLAGWFADAIEVARDRAQEQLEGAVP